MKIIRGRRTAVAAATAAGVMAAAGAWAAIPTSMSGEVTGCYSTTTPFRIIDGEAGQTCQTNEKPISLAAYGAMRWAGEWTEGNGPGNVASGLRYPNGNKGAVVHMKVDRHKFGCTTPQGLWMSVTDSYSYPCLESPQNWVMLSEDAKPESDPSVHWFNTDAAGKITAGSDTGYRQYNYTGYGFYAIPGVDPSKCGITASSRSYSGPTVTISAEEYYGYILVTARNSSNGQYAAVPVSVAVNCKGSAATGASLRSAPKSRRLSKPPRLPKRYR